MYSLREPKGGVGLLEVQQVWTQDVGGTGRHEEDVDDDVDDNVNDDYDDLKMQINIQQHSWLSIMFHFKSQCLTPSSLPSGE